MPILTLEESVAYVRANHKELYAPPPAPRKTIGNVPSELHSELLEHCEANNLKMFELVGGLWDLYLEYEETHKDELKKQRAKRR